MSDLGRFERLPPAVLNRLLKVLEIVVNDRDKRKCKCRKREIFRYMNRAISNGGDIELQNYVAQLNLLENEDHIGDLIRLTDDADCIVDFIGWVPGRWSKEKPEIGRYLSESRHRGLRARCHRKVIEPPQKGYAKRGASICKGALGRGDPYASDIVDDFASVRDHHNQMIHEIRTYSEDELFALTEAAMDKCDKLEGKYRIVQKALENQLFGDS